MWQRIHTHTHAWKDCGSYGCPLSHTHTSARDGERQHKQTKEGNAEEHLNAVCWLEPKITSDVEQEAHFSLLMNTLTGYAAVRMQIIMTLFTADNLSE